MSYDKAKHLVEVDEKILAVFIVDSTEKIESFIAKDADIERSIVESVKATLDLIRNQDTESITRQSYMGSFRV